MTTRGKCPPCKRASDHARGSATARGYDQHWATYSKAWLARHPWCGQRIDGRCYPEHSACTRLGLRVTATVTDHILAMKAGGARFDPSNHQSLCGPCNRRKAIREEGALARIR